jgi:hypothetical protein
VLQKAAVLRVEQSSDQRKSEVKVIAKKLQTVDSKLARARAEMSRTKPGSIENLKAAARVRSLMRTHMVATRAQQTLKQMGKVDQEVKVVEAKIKRESKKLPPKKPFIKRVVKKVAKKSRRVACK